MKKSYLIIFVTLYLVSCIGLEGKNSTVFYEKIPADASVYLRKVEVKPAFILTDVSEEIPELIRTCLTNNGFSLALEDSDTAYKLDVILNSRIWQEQYNSVESVTLSMRFYQKEQLAAFRLYTEDTEKSIDSFLWTFELIERNIRELAIIIRNEK